MNACLQASMVGDRKSFSLGGATRCRIRRMGVAIDVDGSDGARAEALIVCVS